MDYLYKAIFYKRKYSNLELKKKKRKGSWRAQGISSQAGLPGSEPETSRVLGRYGLLFTSENTMSCPLWAPDTSAHTTS